jgi:hypothetical protein
LALIEKCNWHLSHEAGSCVGNGELTGIAEAGCHQPSAFWVVYDPVFKTPPANFWFSPIHMVYTGRTMKKIINNAKLVALESSGPFPHKSGFAYFVHEADGLFKVCEQLNEYLKNGVSFVDVDRDAKVYKIAFDCDSIVIQNNKMALMDVLAYGKTLATVNGNEIVGGITLLDFMATGIGPIYMRLSDWMMHLVNDGKESK